MDGFKVELEWNGAKVLLKFKCSREKKANYHA
jgi:hypothetical protein